MKIMEVYSELAQGGFSLIYIYIASLELGPMTLVGLLKPKMLPERISLPINLLHEDLKTN